MVKSANAASAAGGAHIVFVGNDAAAKDVIAALASQPVVTVGEGPSFLADGGVIRLFANGDKIQCAINLKASETAGVKLGEKLVRASNG